MICRAAGVQRRRLTSWFHALSAGNIGQPPSVGPGGRHPLGLAGRRSPDRRSARDRGGRDSRRRSTIGDGRPATAGRTIDASAADLAHRALGPDEVDLVDLVPGPLRADGPLGSRAATSSSVSPARIASRRSNSSLANRHVRNWPSAVRRTRSQSPQNGLVTVGMTPTVPRAVEVAPPVGRRRAAGRHLLERVHGVDRADDLVLADDLVVHPVRRRRRAA